MLNWELVGLCGFVAQGSKKLAGKMLSDFFLVTEQTSLQSNGMNSAFFCHKHGYSLKVIVVNCLLPLWYILIRKIGWLETELKLCMQDMLIASLPTTIL